MGSRVIAMIIKELLAILRDPRGRITLIGPPLIQLLLFSSAATLEVKNINIGVYNRDGGPAASEFLSQLAGSPNVQKIITINTPKELRASVDDQRVIAALVFDENFSRNVAARRPAIVQAIFDGRRSNAAQIVGGYIERIAASTGAAIRPTIANSGGSVVTHWFNPNLEYIWFILPSLIVTVSAISALSVTVLSVARERELGTFDQLMVSPLRLHEILIGKMMAPLLIGLFNATLFIVILPTLYGLHMGGSIFAFYIALTFFLMAVIGIGMVVSSIAQTQQQAFLGMFIVTVPMTLLSGFASPVENMPGWLQLVAQANPQKHFMVVAEGLYLKAMPIGAVLANCWPLAIIAAISLTAATLQFRSGME
jgi:ABC-2 type transport system permease protein